MELAADAMSDLVTVLRWVLGLAFVGLFGGFLFFFFFPISITYLFGESQPQG